MNVLKAWQDSLDIFRPANFKLFLLVTVHSAWQSYKILFKYFWWLLAISVGSPLLVPVLVPKLIAGSPLLTAAFTYNHPVLFAAAIVSIALTMVMSSAFVGWFALLASRASTKKKDFSYFLSYTKHSFYYVLSSILLFAVCAGLIFLFSGVIMSVIKTAAPIIPTIKNILFIVTNIRVIKFVLIVPFECSKVIAYVLVLFFVGGPASINNFFFALGRSIKFFVYNLPFWVIGYCLPIWALRWLAPYIAASGSPIALIGQLLYGLFLFIIPICYITNYYIKQMHEQRGLYYSE